MGRTHGTRRRVVVGGAGKALSRMDWLVASTFAAVYIGLALGRVPGLAVDRTGIAVLGAFVLIAADRITVTEAWQAVDVPTMGLLFALMILSAQLRVGGFYTAVTDRIVGAALSPRALLAVVVATAGGLSAVVANDIVCLAMAPLLVEACARRGLRPFPYLAGLACAANVGSAATIIGNPQNILVGQTLGIGFGWYLVRALPPAAFGLAVVWGVISWRVRGSWAAEVAPVTASHPALNRWQTAKGLVVVAAVVLAFLLAPWPREVVAIAGAGVLLLSRRTATGALISLVDWPLLLLFGGLFALHHAAGAAGVTAAIGRALASSGLDPTAPLGLAAAAVVLSNLVSNVPATMLLLPHVAGPASGTLLAVASTLAGNLLLVGSIANLIVAEQAARMGVAFGWREHLSVGLPVTAGTLAVAGLWLWLWM